MAAEVNPDPQNFINWKQFNEPLKFLQKGLAKSQELIQKIKTIAMEVFDVIQEYVESVSIKKIVATINSIGTDIEKLFNIANSTPFLCFAGAYLRDIVGKLQIIAGAILFCIGEFGKITNPEGSPLFAKWNIVSKLGSEHVIHGCLNVLRGYAEGCVAALTMGLGNVLLFIPNLKKDFNPYTFSYGTLVNPLLNEEAKKAPSKEDAHPMSENPTADRQLIAIEKPVEKVPENLVSAPESAPPIKNTVDKSEEKKVTVEVVASPVSEELPEIIKTLLAIGPGTPN